MTFPGEGNSGDGGMGLTGIIFLSLLAHVLGLSLLVFSAPLLPPPRLTFGPVYSVQLVNMPAGSLDNQGGEAAARNLLDFAPTRQPLLNKTSLDPLAVPVNAADVRKKSIESVEKAVEAIRKNIAPSGEKPQPTPAVPAAARVTSQSYSSSSRSGEADLNGAMRNYYAVIWSRIKGSWTIPQGLLPAENIEAVVHAKILRDGTIANVGLEKRSGNRYFDDSALRTVKKANPLPALPDELRENSIEIGIRFHSAEFK